jgi:hypothetical protein
MVGSYIGSSLLMKKVLLKFIGMVFQLIFVLCVEKD